MRLVLGGLRPGTSEPMDETMKRDIEAHWRHVGEATGQPFDFAFFDREGFVYDTEPPSRAIVAVRRQGQDAAFEFLKVIQGAFYARNRDVTDREVLLDLAAEAGMKRNDFAADFDLEETRVETRNDFTVSRQAGINGFPALIAGSDADGYEVITIGYRPWVKLEPLIKSWLDR